MPERPAGRAAVPVSFGLALIGVAVALVWFWPDDGWRVAALGPFSLGLCFLVWGIYQLVDTIDRAARALIERR